MAQQADNEKPVNDWKPSKDDIACWLDQAVMCDWSPRVNFTNGTKIQ